MRHRGRCLTLTLSSLSFATLPLSAQDAVPSSHLKVSPGWFAGGGERTVGARWDALWARNSKQLGHVQPAPIGTCVSARPADEYSVLLESTGGLALKQRANADPTRIAARGSLWRSFYRPGCPGPDPDLPPTGGYYRGSGSISAFVRGEGIQGAGEFDVSSGVELLYTHSRMDGAWVAVPSLQFVAGAVRPVQSTLRDSLAEDKTWLSRGELHVTWHIPLPAQLRLDVNVRGWHTAGLADTLRAIGLDRGAFLALDVTRRLQWNVGGVAIRELFVRRVEGEVPQEWRQRRSWLVGVATGSSG